MMDGGGNVSLTVTVTVTVSSSSSSSSSSNSTSTPFQPHSNLNVKSQSPPQLLPPYPLQNPLTMIMISPYIHNAVRAFAAQRSLRIERDGKGWDEREERGVGEREKERKRKQFNQALIQFDSIRFNSIPISPTHASNPPTQQTFSNMPASQPVIFSPPSLSWALWPLSSYPSVNRLPSASQVKRR